MYIVWKKLSENLHGVSKLVPSCFVSNTTVQISDSCVVFLSHPVSCLSAVDKKKNKKKKPTPLRINSCNRLRISLQTLRKQTNFLCD